MQAADDDRAVDRLPRAAPVVAAVLLAALLFCFVRQQEVWPLSGWELFSRLRKADQPGWAATEVADGAERPLPFGRLPRSFHNAGHVMAHFPAMDEGRRLEACNAWFLALVAIGDNPSEVRVYRTTTHLRLDGRPPTVTRRLYSGCKVAG